MKNDEVIKILHELLSMEIKMMIYNLDKKNSDSKFSVMSFLFLEERRREVFNLLT